MMEEEEDVLRRLRVFSIHSNSESCNFHNDIEEGENSGLCISNFIKAVQAFLLPTENMVSLALSGIAYSRNSDYTPAHSEREERIGSNCEITAVTSHPITDYQLHTMIADAARFLGKSRDDLMEEIGHQVFLKCLEKYDRELRMIGSSLAEFFSNLDGLKQYADEKMGASPSEEQMPSFRCSMEHCGSFTLHMYTERQITCYMCGVIRSVSEYVFCKPGYTEVMDDNKGCVAIHVTAMTLKDRLCATQDTGMRKKQLSNNAGDLNMSMATFCKAFPFHVIFGRDMVIKQLGAILLKIIAPYMPSKGRDFSTYFDIKTPLSVRFEFRSILSAVSLPFVIVCNCTSNSLQRMSKKGMELRGQMIYLAESDSVLFLGSPLVEKLEQLVGEGIFISDIPIHDATRDVILVGEQTKAQDSLKKRMVQLNTSIEEATVAVAAERQKNVQLLNLIFPAGLARKLWLGEPVKPQLVEEVTMLFSDIVGFTSICSTATPLQVINMLNALYTQFDILCALLDVYKIETIGDAYCVAGGLHKVSRYHGQQTAWMALKMIQCASQQTSHDGNPIQVTFDIAASSRSGGSKRGRKEMRIGLHTGSVLGGVVGTKMPRYCLFGNNVTLANRFESHSQPNKVNISPTTYRLLQKTPGFHYTPRSQDQLPAGFHANSDETCYFLDGYTHHTLSPADHEDHILAAARDFGISSVSLERQSFSDTDGTIVAQ